MESVPLLDGDNYEPPSSRRQKRAERTTEFYERRPTPSVPPGLERNQQRDQRQRNERPPPRYDDAIATQSRQHRFRPYFIVTVTLVEIAVFIYEIVAGGIAPISFTPTTEELVSVPVFGQNYNESVKRVVISNWFIGPDPTFLVHNAAKYSLVRNVDTRFLASFIDCSL